MHPRNRFGARLAVFLVFALALLFSVTLQAQSQKPSSSTTAPTKDENSQETTTFKLHVNLVEVHVVVRDSKGNAVPNLKKEDFRLFDKGKLQMITTFGIETPETRKERALAAARTQSSETPADSTEKTLPPDHFIGMLFDDMHLTASDLLYTKKSALQFLDTLGPTDRVAFYSTSGQFTHEFSPDKDELKRSLASLGPHPSLTNTAGECPKVSFYLANRFENLQDAIAFNIVFQDALNCAFGGDTSAASEMAARQLAQSAIQQTYSFGLGDMQIVYDNLQAVIRRLAVTPGERTLIFVSPGFSLATDHSRAWDVMDLANRDKIVINTLDARGLYTPDIYSGTNSGSQDPIKINYLSDAQFDQGVILGDLAYGTGGTYFHNSNDIASGLQKMAAAPAVSYVLGFSPQSPKADGSFHKLQVKLSDATKYEVQARLGYYAPKKAADAEEQAAADIDDAILSRSELLDIPMELQTQYFMKSPGEAELSVLTRLNIKGIRFRQLDDHNYDKLTVVTAVFDDNGNFLLGEQKKVNLKLSTLSYNHFLNSGLTIRSTLALKPGKYTLRQVVRETEGSQMAARTGTVVIPN